MNILDRFRKSLNDIYRSKEPFECRVNLAKDYMEAMADEGKSHGFTAKQKIGKSVTRVGKHRMVTYDNDYIPIDPDGNEIGNEVFGSRFLAIASGYLGYKKKEYPKTAASVNKYFKENGYIGYKIIKGKDHYYFNGPNTHKWHGTMILVNHVSDLTLEEWLAELRYKIEDYVHYKTP